MEEENNDEDFDNDHDNRDDNTGLFVFLDFNSYNLMTARLASRGSLLKRVERKKDK